MHRISFSLSRALLYPRSLSRPCSTTLYNAVRGRGFCDEAGRKDGQRSAADMEALFDPENVRGLSQQEVEKLKVVYGMVIQHMKETEDDEDGLDNSITPLIDTRSFDLKQIPRLPSEILSEFRTELPGDVAGESRPVSTSGVWDQSGEGMGGSELEGEHAQDWENVDEKTMDARGFSRMKRQMRGGAMPGMMMTGRAGNLRKKKRKCMLTNEDGKVDVDFKEVGKLNEFLTDNGKVIARRKTGVSAKAQRKLSKAVKRARHMALIHPEPDFMPSYEELVELEKKLQRGEMM